MTTGICACGCGGVTPIATVTRPSRGYVNGQPMRYVQGHQCQRMPVLDRVLTRCIETAIGCWEFQGAIAPNGYGVLGRGPRGTGVTSAHRITYEHLIADIPASLDLDHLCRNRACCNPWHLEPVTRRVNAERGLATKLTVTDVLQIRRLYAAGDVRQRELAEKFKVNRSTISAIITRRTWPLVRAS